MILNKHDQPQEMHMTTFKWTSAVLFCLALIGPTQTWAQDEGRRSGAFAEDRWRVAVPDGKNSEPVRDAFKSVLATAAEATVRVLADGKPVALATIVDADGYLVSKASLLEGKITCRMRDGKVLPVIVAATDETNDLALLRVETKTLAKKLVVAPWRADKPKVGSFVAAVGPLDDALAVGIVSSEPRRIENYEMGPRRKAWLGIAVGGDTPTAVASVEPGSPAERAGLHIGDEIRQIDDHSMDSADSVINTVAQHKSKEKIKLLVHRENEDKVITAVLQQPKATKAPQDYWGGGPFSERRWGFPVALPHDVPILPRDCGGPLVDTDGRVVGVNIARALRVSTFALPADKVRSLVAELKKKAKS
jgi:serine protease Do